MAINKKLEFKGDEVKLATLSKALAHPARVAIVKLLSQNGPTIVNKLVEELPLSQSTVSQHLRELKDAGIIKGEIDGPRVFYSIDHDQLQLTKIFFDRFFNQVIRVAVN
jgi:DNA-binding transcriptional ArsR family regulator